MVGTADTRRLWGWDTWLKNQVFPLAVPAAGRSESQLWIFFGPRGSGRNDLLNAVEVAFQNSAEMSGEQMIALRHDPATSLHDYTEQVAEVFQRAGAVSEALTVGAGGGGADEDPLDRALGSSEFDEHSSGVFVVQDADLLPPSWWRAILPEWLARHPKACLMMSAEQRVEALVDAFRTAGGSLKGVFQREISPWDEATIETWRRQFFPHEKRSVQELKRASRGGWAGSLWDLMETVDQRADTASSRFHLRRVLTSLSPHDRECLLAVARAPLPSRDYAEAILDREVSEAAWRAMTRLWRRSSLIGPDGQWISAVLRRQIQELCKEFGDDVGRADAKLLKALPKLHGFLPQEYQRRLLAPVSVFEHVDRDVLVSLLGERGWEVWDVLRATPGACLRGPNPVALNPEFLAVLSPYAEALTEGNPSKLADRLHALWKKRQSALQAEIDAIATRRAKAQNQLKVARKDQAKRQKGLETLLVQRRTKPGPARVQRRPNIDLTRQVLGATGILAGIGWIYLSFIQSNTFQLYPTLGGLALLGLGFGAAFGQREPKAEAAEAILLRKEARARAEALEKSIGSAQAQLRLARDMHEEISREVKQLEQQEQDLEACLDRPYING